MRWTDTWSSALWWTSAPSTCGAGAASVPTVGTRTLALMEVIVRGAHARGIIQSLQECPWIQHALEAALERCAIVQEGLWVACVT